MFDYLKGEVFRKYSASISLLCGSIGFKVFVPLSLLRELSEGEVVELFVEPVFPPEGAPVLYGFKSEEERELFRELLKIPKVGSKVALSILSHLTPERLMDIVESGNVEELSSVPGLGRKLSLRIIGELSGRLEKKSSIPQEVVEVLLSLGYKRSEIDSLKGINLTDMSIEEAVKEAVKRLSGRRS
ncbi:MAG: hypothetical protein DSZ25_01680 [Thermovibrio sp.]|nr:MAG: hypothetical protein DSZ25_01680 [Thermovibrio sp.]